MALRQAANVTHKSETKMDKKASQLIGESVRAGIELQADSLIPCETSDGSRGILFICEHNIGTKGGTFYLVVSKTRVLFYTVKRRLLGSVLGDLVEEFPRTDVTAVHVQEFKDRSPSVLIGFCDGTFYKMTCTREQVPQVLKVKGYLVVDTL